MNGDFIQIADLLFRIGWAIAQLVAFVTLFQNMPFEKTWKSRAIYAAAAFIGASVAFMLAAARTGGAQ